VKVTCDTFDEWSSNGGKEGWVVGCKEAWWCPKTIGYSALCMVNSQPGGTVSAIERKRKGGS